MKIFYESSGDPKAWTLLQDLERDCGPWMEFILEQIRRELGKISDFRLGDVGPAMNLPCRRCFSIRSDFWNRPAHLTFLLRIEKSCRLEMEVLTGNPRKGPVTVLDRAVVAAKPNIECALRKLFGPANAVYFAKAIKAAVPPASPKHWMPARKDVR